MLTSEDFKGMGIALADARLLVEKYKNAKRAEELASMVAAVRKEGIANKKKKVNEKIKVEYSWHHFDSNKRKHTVVKSSSGGGVRSGEFNGNTTLSSMFEDMKTKYFPGGRNKKGKIKDMECVLLGGDKENIDDLESTIACFIELKGLKTRKFYLQTKHKKFTDCYLDSYLDSDDSLNDFDIDVDGIFKSTPKEKSANREVNKKLQLIKNKIKSQDEAYDASLAADEKKEEERIKKLREEQDKTKHEVEQERMHRLQLIKSQNEAYDASLAADKNKGEERIMKLREEQERTKREEALRLRQSKRRAHLLPEPSLNDDSVLVVVNHLHFGRKERFFLSTETCESIYNWIGSLSPEPELFELRMIPNTLVDPNWVITKVERNVLNMSKKETSDFTMDIDINTSLLPEDKPSCSYKNNDDLVCPVCSSKQPSQRLLELHATQCADDKYVEIYSIADSSDDEQDLPEVKLAPTSAQEQMQECVDSKALIKSIKCEIEKCCVDPKALRLKIRRGSAFTDFCERLDKKWIAKNIGFQLSIEFYGEIGVDQGGPKRDFFSGKKIKIQWLPYTLFAQFISVGIQCFIIFKLLLILGFNTQYIYSLVSNRSPLSINVLKIFTPYH